MALNAAVNLLQKYGLNPNDVGRLEVGTETLVDKSKSTKTELMGLFGPSNTSLEGVTSVNACYGGTAALFHSVDWMESSAWDGRYAMVICGDIAVYEPGPARPTGGAGVVAMLIGPNAPLRVESSMRSSHFENAYDFYKPRLNVEYPVVDGKLSNSCYLRSIDRCFQLYAQKFKRQTGEDLEVETHFQHSLFHLPYTKLVQKSYARFLYNEVQTNPKTRAAFAKDVVEPFSDVSEEDSYTNRDLEKSCLKAMDEKYASRVFPGTLGGRRLGNLYTGSLYAGLLSAIANPAVERGERISMFSYGSGSAATLFSLKVDGDLKEQRDACDFVQRLDARTKATPEDYAKTLELRERYHGGADVEPPMSPAESFKKGEYYLSKIDSQFRRGYARSGLGATLGVSPISAPGKQTTTSLGARQLSTLVARGLRYVK